MLATDIDRRIVRSLTAFAIGYGSGIPLIVNFLIIKKKFDSSEWLTYLSMMVTMLIGLALGNAVHHYVNQQVFRAFLMFLLFCGSINLMLIDMGDISMYSSLMLMVIFLLLFIGLIVNIVTNTLRRRGESAEIRKSQDVEDENVSDIQLARVASQSSGPSIDGIENASIS